MVSRINEIQFTSPDGFIYTTIWRAPAAISHIELFGCGGGGGGGSGLFATHPTWRTPSGGGGGGAIARTEYVTVIPGNNYVITIGRGGESGKNVWQPPAGNGGDGGTTSITGDFIITGGVILNTTIEFPGGNGGMRGVWSALTASFTGGTDAGGKGGSLRDFYRENVVNIMQLAAGLPGYNYIPCGTWDQQPGAGGSGLVQAGDFIGSATIINSPQSDGVGSSAGGVGGVAGVDGSDDATYLGGAGGGGGGAGPFKGSDGGNGGDGGDGDATGTSGTGADGDDGTGFGSGGGGGGATGTGLATPVVIGKSGGSGRAGILYIRWVE